MMRLSYAMAMLLALAPVAGRAATVTFDLTSLGNISLAAGQSETLTLGGSVDTSGGVTTTVSGLTVTLVAMSYQGSSIATTNSQGQQVISNFSTSGFFPTVTQSALNFNSAGAGVTNPQESFLGYSFDSPDVDTAGGYVDFFEILLSQDATLNSAAFTDNYTTGGRSPKSKSDFVWASDTTGAGGIGNGDVISAPTKLTDGSTAFGGATSSAFLIAAAGNNSDWRLASVTLSYTPNVTTSVVSAVPLPATGFLLLGAFGGLGVLVRRRRRS